jgi:hypothetical protein
MKSPDSSRCRGKALCPSDRLGIEPETALRGVLAGNRAGNAEQAIRVPSLAAPRLEGTPDRSSGCCAGGVDRRLAFGAEWAMARSKPTAKPRAMPRLAPRDHARDLAAEAAGLLAKALNHCDSPELDYRYADAEQEQFLDLMTELVKLIETGRILDLRPDRARADMDFQRFVEQLHPGKT